MPIKINGKCKYNAYTMEVYEAIKKNEALSFMGKRIEMEISS